MTKEELEELVKIKFYLRKVKNICKENHDFCKSCPFSIQKAVNYSACALGDVPEIWLIDKMK